MKKHPVDDLFQKRLTSLEKKPSELAWQRIQEGQKKKSRRMVAWVWYAAASVVLTFISGYLVWQVQNDNSSPVRDRSEIAKIEKTIHKGQKEKNTRESLPIEIESPAKNELTNSLPVVEPFLAQHEVSEKAALTRQTQERSIKNSIIDHSTPVQIAEIEPVKVEEVKVEKAEIQQSVSPEKVMPKNVELAQREEKKPDRTIIVEIEEPEQEMKDKSKSRLSRVFRQLKNVREAEPVDWDDVGFNPKSIIARADDRTNEDGKISGKRERKN